MNGSWRFWFCAMSTELKPEPEPEVALRALNAEATKLRKRHDEITAECITLRQKLHQMVERTSGFTKSADLSAGANEDAAEVAELEAELADVEAEIDVANHDHSTYGLMIERIRSEEKTYRRDLNEIDFQSSAKQADAKKLYLMLKDATDVRNAAEAELFRQDKTLSLELAAQVVQSWRTTLLPPCTQVLITALPLPSPHRRRSCRPSATSCRPGSRPRRITRHARRRSCVLWRRSGWTHSLATSTSHPSARSTMSEIGSPSFSSSSTR